MKDIDVPMLKHVLYEETPMHFVSGRVMSSFMHYSRCFPLARMYIILKDTEHTDEDCIFVIRTAAQLKKVDSDVDNTN